MKRFLTFFLISFFILIPNVFAESLLPVKIYVNNQFLDPLFYNVNDIGWYGNTTHTPTNKWSVQYDTRNYDSSLTYNITGAIYSSNSISDLYGTPVVAINDQYCSINNTYKLDYDFWPDYYAQDLDGSFPNYTADGGKFYSTKISSISTFTCTGVRLSSNAYEWLTILLGYSADYLRITNLSLYSTENSDILNQQQETNEKIEQQIQQQQQQIQEQEKTNQELGELNDNLTNSEAPDGMDSLGSAGGWLPPGPVDSLLTLPLSMLNNISTSLGSTCKPIELPLPFVNKNMTLPCLNTVYSQISGLGTLLNTLGTIGAGFMLYYYFKKLYAYIDNLLSLQNNGEGWGDV